MYQYITSGSPLPSYYMFPHFLLQMDLAETDRLVYMLLFNRSKLSSGKPDWTDNEQRVFVFYTITSLAAALSRSSTTIKSCLKKLEEADLIERKRQGACKPNRIYVKIPDNLSASSAVGKQSTGKPENLPHEGQISIRTTAGKPTANKKDMNKKDLVKRGSKGHTAAANINRYECEEDESL